MKRKVTDFIVNHCYVIFACFLALTAICGILATKVNINRDIYSYMPENSETSQGMAIMNDEFDYSATSSYEMMLKDVPASEKWTIKSNIESISNVSSVDYDDSDTYNRDPYTRYKINISVPADSPEAATTYDTIHDEYAAKYEIAETGQVSEFNGAVIQVVVLIGAVGCAMLILTLMSESYIEPWLYLIAIILAVIVNKGTNIIFPNVSHITDSIAAILQMALSMDYAIMLSSRYRQEKLKPDCPDKMTAMRRAMRYSFGAISSSSVTTVVGLIVLVFMSFTIGKDMGLVLSKGVILSLVSIFTSLPALLLIFDKAIEKTHKKVLTLNMTGAGKTSFHLRHIALPIFLFIFIGSVFLKGSTNILYTGSENNKVKDVFDETNQTALVYDKDMDEKVTEICKEYDAREDTTRVLCYGNTINEPEKYNEIKPKAESLGSELNTEDYLIKLLYYHYYKDTKEHTVQLDEFVNFVQNEVLTNPNFSDEISASGKADIERFSNFVVAEKANRLRSKAELAQILEIDSSKLDDLYVLYLSKYSSGIRLTLHQFASFVLSEIATDPDYSSMISASQYADLSNLLKFSNPNITHVPKTAAELAQIFGLNTTQVERLLTYYNYTTTDIPTTALTISDLINYALNNETIIQESGLSPEDVANIKNAIANAKDNFATFRADLEAQYAAFLATLPEDQREIVNARVTAIVSELEQKANTIITKQHTYDDYIQLATEAKEFYTQFLAELQAINDQYGFNLDLSQLPTTLDFSPYLEKLKDVYTLYQAETTASTTRISAIDLVDFILGHLNDDRLKGAFSADAISRLQLAQYIMYNQSTRYSSYQLAQTFGLNVEQLKLVFALYEYRYVSGAPQLSLKTLVNFLNDIILPNETYASRLSSDQRTKIAIIANLMHSAEAGIRYNYISLYQALSPLSDSLDLNQLFLVSLYHGSIYDYDENWTLTIEKFINFLADNVLSDTRFTTRIDTEMRQKIIDGQKTIHDAKELLVGPKHYRMLVETNLPAEGEQTFSFIKGLKDRLGDGNKTSYYLIGDSPMAYEMSLTFNDEMNFITILTMLSIFIVVAITFKSIFVSILLVLVIQSAVYIVMSYLSLTGQSIYFIALIIVQAILMGATIDYAILFTSYYTESRGYFQMGIKDALINSYNKSIHAILTSASILTVVTAIVGNFASAIAAKICQAISLGTFCATVIILVLLPALIATLDRFIVKKQSTNS